MVESPDSSSAHQELLTIKDSILVQWQRLPPEHQASMLLVLMNNVLNSEYGPWAANAVKLLSTQPETPPPNTSAPPISSADLARHTDLAPDEIALLSAEDLKDISAAVTAHLIFDVFWDEVEDMARQRLDQTR
ncbi:MAG: hypothetical protein M5U05_18785 [Anaerolineales bacterium]|nr:hypothetical protein [Anaerolineales bacterium]